MLNREVRTICPTCAKPLKGKIYEKDSRVFLEKACPEHGIVTDMLSSNTVMFQDRMSLLEHASPNKCNMAKCREGIFKCADHIARKSPLAFIEITTRCNMKCPVCYADAEAKGKDMPLEDLYRIIDVIAEQDKNTHVILIGGEPTIHGDFFKILERLRRKGLMKRTFIATNSITLADKEFCGKVHEAGIKKFFLGFDGTDREACKKIRGSYLAYDSLRKALENIRENGKAWIILSITAVRDINVEDIPGAMEFAMKNSDIVKRVMISPEVYCGRIDQKENPAETRLTGDCIEDFLRKELKVKVATVSLSLFFALMKPLKNMGVLGADSWVSAMPSPFCGNMGFIWKDKNNRYRSIIDLLVKGPAARVYEAGRKINLFSDRILNARRKKKKNFLSEISWALKVYLYFLPAYCLILLSYLNKTGLFELLGAFVRAGFNVKKFKNAFFGKNRVELYYLLGSDRYNYIWDKMPYCLTHHYRVHPDSGEVIKLPGCFVFSLREELEK
ncbi:MAG: radical SAM protein [Candidatus Omnitrophota bacterium]